MGQSVETCGFEADTGGTSQELHSHAQLGHIYKLLKREPGIVLAFVSA
jgi:hypothetical protein